MAAIKLVLVEDFLSAAAAVVEQFVHWRSVATRLGQWVVGTLSTTLVTSWLDFTDTQIQRNGDNGYCSRVLVLAADRSGGIEALVATAGSGFSERLRVDFPSAAYFMV